LSRARAMGDYLRYESVLPPRLSEFVILLVAREWTQHYEWHAHRDIAVEAGLNPEIVAALAAGEMPRDLAEDEAVLYAFCTELQREKQVSDATYARALALFGEQGVIDAVGIMGYYTLLAMVMNTARTPVPGNPDPELAPQ
ncbi:MAG TPA: carboxymuconolactone decarboxylase family protein, partial [Gammaproteobacteria bacterium]